MGQKTTERKDGMSSTDVTVGGIQDPVEEGYTGPTYRLGYYGVVCDVSDDFEEYPEPMGPYFKTEEECEKFLEALPREEILDEARSCLDPDDRFDGFRVVCVREDFENGISLLPENEWGDEELPEVRWSVTWHVYWRGKKPTIQWKRILPKRIVDGKLIEE